MPAADTARLIASLELRDAQFNSAMKNVEAKLDKITGKFKGIGTAAGIGAAVGTKGIELVGQAVDFVTDEITRAIKAASDLTESQSKSNVVFGESSKLIEQFASTSARSLGVSKRAATEAAATFGNFFTGLGEDQREAAEMSRRLVELAADLASFNNLPSVEDAIGKLRSGLSGESEPLRAVGVFLTESKVKAKAMELGLAGAHGELSEGAKVLARYKLILEETTSAQGDAARTGDELAGMQRRRNAQLEDTEARFGKALVPVQKLAEEGKIAVLDFVSTGLEGWEMLGNLISGKSQEIVDTAGDTGKEAGRALSAQWTAAQSKQVRDALDAMKQLEDGTELHAKVAAAQIGQVFGLEFSGVKAAISAPDSFGVGAAAMDALADGIDARRQAPLDAMSRLTAALKDPLSEYGEFVRLKGQLFGTELIKGINSIDPVAVARAQAAMQTITERILQIGGKAELQGILTSKEFAEGIKASDPDTRRLYEQFQAAVQARLKELEDPAASAGQGAGMAVAGPNGLLSPSVDHAVDSAGTTLGRSFGGSFGDAAAASAVSRFMGRISQEVTGAGLPSLPKPYTYGGSLTDPGDRFFASGGVGIATRPTRAIFGEAGNEAWAFLRNPHEGNIGGSPTIVNISLSLNTRELTEYQVRQSIAVTGLA